MTRNENKHSTEEETQLKLSERLLEARTLVICGEIHQKLAKEVCEKLIVLSNESDKQIWIYLNSQGGHVEAGDTIFDMIQFVKARVRIIGTGWVASAGALIYSAPPKEDRFALPNTRFMLHQPFGGAGGQASDVKIEAEELLKMRERLNAIFAKQTGQPIVK
ncbi:MAG TPA: ATP-dependent Clp protease proteolytic subunit, partial [Verrucomicrobia bacterium]|nr:ATP-dependent Clp protease proteolytic subunit [Verrucomicrobiota bacterium]